MPLTRPNPDAAQIAGTVASAMQAAALATLRAEMLGLRLVLPCHESEAETEARLRREDEELEAAFDNLPV